MILAKDISFFRNEINILKNVNCSLEKGKLTVLIGANGSGKSTLFKIFSGEIHPDSGQIFFDGKPMVEMTEHQIALRRAALSQGHQLTFPFKVREVISLGAYPRFKGRWCIEAHNIVQEVIKLVGLDSFTERLYTTLSSGEKQRVQLARSLVQIWDESESYEDKVLMLDEPTSNLDPLHQVATLEIAKYFAGKGCTVLAIIHDINHSMLFSDNVWALHNGTLIADGPSDKVMNSDLIFKLFGIRTELVRLNQFSKPNFLLSQTK